VGTRCLSHSLAYGIENSAFHERVVHRRDPCAARSARHEADAAPGMGGPCGPTWASPGVGVWGRGYQALFLKRQLSLPVSTMSQW
jgi:hypothetical protein